MKCIPYMPLFILFNMVTHQCYAQVNLFDPGKSGGGLKINGAHSSNSGNSTVDNEISNNKQNQEDSSDSSTAAAGRLSPQQQPSGSLGADSSSARKPNMSAEENNNIQHPVPGSSDNPDQQQQPFGFIGNLVGMFTNSVKNIFEKFKF